MWYLLTLNLVTLNLADYFLTARLVRVGGAEIESNPLARLLCENLGLLGMFLFKISIVALVVGILHVVRNRRPNMAWTMQLTFTALMLAVVAYNSWLVRLCNGIPGGLA
jgi:uncharacterized membrane protein